jgi:hypothetical protein
MRKISGISDLADHFGYLSEGRTRARYEAALLCSPELIIRGSVKGLAVEKGVAPSVQPPEADV